MEASEKTMVPQQTATKRKNARYGVMLLIFRGKENETR